MTLTDTLTALEQIKAAVEALKTDRNEAAQYLSFIDSELTKLAAQQKQLEAQSIGAFKGRSNWTHEQRIETRRAIRGVTGRAVTIGDICQCLPNIDRALIEKEVEYMVERKSIVWNGGRGPASTYRRAE